MEYKKGKYIKIRFLELKLSNIIAIESKDNIVIKLNLKEILKK